MEMSHPSSKMKEESPRQRDQDMQTLKGEDVHRNGNVDLGERIWG